MSEATQRSPISWILPEAELSFLLFDWLRSEELCERPAFADHDREGFEAMLEVARQLAEEKFAPHAAKLDANEPTFDG